MVYNEATTNPDKSLIKVLGSFPYLSALEQQLCWAYVIIAHFHTLHCNVRISWNGPFMCNLEQFKIGGVIQIIEQAHKLASSLYSIVIRRPDP